MDDKAQVSAEWFRDWFNSPYYHKLYKHRDQSEAASFIAIVMQHYPLAKGARVLDLACGRGRHAVHLSKYGLDVTGLDLSENNIAFAQKMSNKHLQFFVHDMRHPFRSNYFNAVFNLFTSFGYFARNEDNQKVFDNAYNALKPGGRFIFDYLNASKPLQMQSEESGKADDFEFHVRRRHVGDWIVKYIDILHGAQELHFTEQVRMYTPQILQSMMQKAGFMHFGFYGDYLLRPFEPSTSDRFICIAQKFS